MNKNNNNVSKFIKISLVNNIIVFVMTAFASIVMFTGFKFMYGYDIILESTKLGMLRFFTVQSNLFVGIISLIFAINEIQIINGNKKEISKINYILKLMSTTAVGLTFFIVFSYLGPISEHGVVSLLMNSNLFFHLIIPIFSILNFTLFEKTDKIQFKDCIYGILPTVIYGIYYIINVLIHMENGKVSNIYDWYWFVQNGVWTAIIVVPIIFIIAYVISIVIWRCNKKTCKHKNDSHII